MLQVMDDDDDDHEVKECVQVINKVEVLCARCYLLMRREEKVGFISSLYMPFAKR